MSDPSLETLAIESLAPRKFHQIFTIPATSEHESLRVTYSIAGIEFGEDVPTILFCGGMFGTRWQAVFMDFVAAREGVRMLFIDRPGFGGSTQVELPQRIPTFLETIPLLLSHLQIKNVSLATQSAGTIYGLNVLSCNPDLLSPTNPRVTFFSPWVHQSHTSVSFLQVASMLPNPLLNQWNKLTGFIINNAQPAFAVSGGAITAVSSAFKSKVTTQAHQEEEAKKCLDGFGTSLKLKKEIDKLLFKYAFEEDTKGANDDARLCLKSIPGTNWGACEDYHHCVKNLAEVWEKRVADGGKKLQVTIVLPESDAMVGDNGMKYYEDCWAKERCGKGIEVTVTKVKGTDHDSTASPGEGSIEKMIAEAKDT